MSPQHSNRSALLEGALRCLERLPADRMTARAIADEAGANVASIAYHFGSKDDLVTAAVIEGLDRWLGEIAQALGELSAADPVTRFRRAAAVVETTGRRHAGLAANFLGALARAQHDPRIRDALAEGFRRSRADVANVLGLGADRAGQDAGQLVLALFDGLLFQALLDSDLELTGARMQAAQARLALLLPTPTT